MAYNEEEMSAADLAAFDLLIGILQEEGKQSVNLRDLILASPSDAMARYRAARDANRQVRHMRNAAQLADAPRVEQPDIDNLTLGQLNVELSLEELIELRRSLER